MTAPLAVHDYAPGGLDAAREFLKRTRWELRNLRKVFVWKDRLQIFDINGDYFEVRGVGYPDADIIPLLRSVNTAFDPATGATEPTLGLKATSRNLEPGADATFTVVAYDDAGNATPSAHAWVSVDGAATQAGSLGRVKVRFVRSGTYAVRATHPGAIRSPTVWVHVGSS